tara:strand:+ start:131 stop:493 length:363 start_codon:yes stop_codon:yes gene_type:complete
MYDMKRKLKYKLKAAATLDLTKPGHMGIFVSIMNEEETELSLTDYCILGAEKYVILPGVTHFLSHGKIKGKTYIFEAKYLYANIEKNLIDIPMDEFIMLLPKEQQEAILWNLDLITEGNK